MEIPSFKNPINSLQKLFFYPDHFAQNQEFSLSLFLHHSILSIIDKKSNTGSYFNFEGILAPKNHINVTIWIFFNDRDWSEL